MAGVDLTRFDFNAKRFLHSDNVRGMSLEEVGQYIILLAEAWLTGKEASLPDDPIALANLCRGKKISEKVLSMFPVVPETDRRRNPTLYGEWLVAVKRSEDGKKSAEARWEPNATAMRPHSDSMSNAMRTTMPKPNQANPTQTIPNESCSFKNISAHYSSFFGLSHSHARKHIEKYQGVCSQYGEDKVLECFDQWAESAVPWLKDRRDQHGLNFFYKPLEDMIAGEDLRLARESKTVKYDAGRQEQESNRLAELAAAEIAAKVAETQFAMENAEAI